MQATKKRNKDTNLASARKRFKDYDNAMREQKYGYN